MNRLEPGLKSAVTSSQSDGVDLGKMDETLLIFGGPYSNLAATRAMREKARDLNISADRVICSGDLAAYCAEPVATIDSIRDWDIQVVMGNCEESLAYQEPDCGCGFEAGSSCSTLSLSWYEYADARVTPGQRSWMRDLPRSVNFHIGRSRFKVVHASVSSINEFVFPSTDPVLKSKQLDLAGCDVIIGGHSGIPFGQKIDRRLWLNSGAIGMPANDGTPEGWYMLVKPEGDSFHVSWHRLVYDHQHSHRTTVAAGMKEYGQALLDGLWPSMDSLPEPERRQRGQSLQLPPLEAVSIQPA